MIIDDLKARVKDAMKGQRVLEKEILRVALGEIQTAAHREGGSESDEAVTPILRKLVKSNRETIALTASAEDKATLEEEIRILESLLPKTLGADEIIAALAPVSAAIRAAAGDGPATGIAMKQLKGAGLTVDGRTVADAVRRLRGG